jgi:peroxiredoxin
MPETTADSHDHDAPGHVEHGEGEAAELAAAPEAAPKVEAPEDLVGYAAPGFTLTDFDGNEHSLADYAGKIVVLDWFNAECPAVIAYYDKPEFVKQMNDALNGQEDVVWLSVKSAGPGKEGHDPEKAKAYAEKIGKTNPILSDETGVVGKSYGALGTPTVFVINPEGTVIYAGAFDEAPGPGDAPKGNNLTLAAVTAAREGKEPAVTQTKAFG